MFIYTANKETELKHGAQNFFESLYVIIHD